jgi:phosphoribosylamine--glycine ligase
MQRHRIPTARFIAAENFEAAVKALDSFAPPVVVKADGLAAGKGVVVARKREAAEKALDEWMRRKTLGSAGERVVIEEGLVGEEISFIVLTDGRGVLPLVPAQDHKPLLDGDQGPNTGGMGAYSDDSILDGGLRESIHLRILAPTLAGLAGEGTPYRGFLYCGLMLTEEGPKVLEYNVRLGDPEAQAILMRLRSDLVEPLAALQQGQLANLEARWSPNPAVCVVLASKGYPGKAETGKPITGFEVAEGQGGVKIFHAATQVQDHQLLSAGGRVLGVTAIGEDLSATIERAYAAVKKIRFDGMQYRRDIGAKGMRRQKSKVEGKQAGGRAGERSVTPPGAGRPKPA